ncbi:MAG: sensor histidine kinase [[Bacteroides] pectinophilus]|nr:sensor histidine kinase [[Bacteroides] pectinophilus]
MQNTESTIYFNFSYFALRLLGKGLYSNHWTAIAELVANGLDAQADSVKIYINLIDQENASIEIFDNGSGMDYNDLSEKYVLIGKDKREDDQISEEIKKQLMGRKGIGKLAALYMSNKYYLVSKKNGKETAWCLDASNVKDSDIPKLDKCIVSNIGIECYQEWEKIQTGTLIRLTNVNLTNFGVKTLEGLKARLSDFYLTDELKGKIEVCVINNAGDNISFEEVKKSIAFKNFYAFYNNTDVDLESKLSKYVKIGSTIEEITEIPRKVQVLDANNYEIEGKKNFIKADGTLTKEKMPYRMTGWIGIHTSIKKVEAQWNDEEYLKNKVYRPNQLRLYVRNKLAVENFLDYVKNTQAFANYIEGEISFDILDDNELGDIATSNRQGFVEDNERVQLLIDILKPIINALIRARSNIGTQINNEEKEFRRAETERIEKERREEEERRIKAEREREAAVVQKEQAEKEKNEQEKRAELLNAHLGSEKKRNHFLVDSLDEDQINFAKRLHMIRINSSTISKVVKNNVMKLKRGKFKEEDAWDCLKKISYLNSRMQAVLEYSAMAQFNTKEEFMEGNLFDFIEEYAMNILNRSDRLKVQVVRSDTEGIEMKFVPQNIAIILDNVVSNSTKYNANELRVLLGKDEKQYTIDFIDDGDGVSSDIADLNELFEFGKGYTLTGTGVGLYHIKDIVEKDLQGTVTIESEPQKGFALHVRFGKV